MPRPRKIRMRKRFQRRRFGTNRGVMNPTRLAAARARARVRRLKGR